MTDIEPTDLMKAAGAFPVEAVKADEPAPFAPKSRLHMSEVELLTADLTEARKEALALRKILDGTDPRTLSTIRWVMRSAAMDAIGSGQSEQQYEDLAVPFVGAAAAAMKHLLKSHDQKEVQS